MHPNQALPYPMLPYHACAWGTRPAPLDTRGWFATVREALKWADGQEGVDTAYVEETLDRYPYRCNGVMWSKVRPGVWSAVTKMEVFDEV
jgi:hypothetical protein